jgi:hypothetical protein
MANPPSHKDLVERANQEREKLLRQIEESQKTVAHSREILARIDAVLNQVDNTGKLDHRRLSRAGRTGATFEIHD